MSIQIIDPSTSGAAGDLLIAVLLDTQEETYRTEFCDLLQNLLSNYDPHFQVKWLSAKNQGFIGTQVLTEAPKKFSLKEMKEILSELSKQMNLVPESHNFAVTTFNYLVNSEVKVHGHEDLEEIHFHELATIDTIFDIIGFAYLWEQLGFLESETFILPIAVGGGLFKIAHGQVSAPGPATIEIIRQGNLIIKGGPIKKELLTPTGAALLASLKASPINYLPLMKIQAIGRSFGSRTFEKDKPTGLQFIRGTKPFNLSKEEINILETNVDDVDGETLGYLFDVLFNENLVLDLTIQNTVTKKNRPGFLIQAIVEPSKTTKVTTVLTRELGTLGVRVLQGFRHVLPREITTHQVKVMNNEETVRLKKSYLDSELISEKIEFEDLRRIARQRGVSLRDIQKRILSEIHKQDEKK